VSTRALARTHTHTHTHTHILEQAGGDYYPEETPVNGPVLILHVIIHDQFIIAFFREAFLLSTFQVTG